MGEGVSVASMGVPDETEVDVGVRRAEVGSVTLVGGGMDGVTEGVTAADVGVMVGIVWFREKPSSASPTGAPKASSRSTSTIRTAKAKGRALIGLSFTPHLSRAIAG
jgi:hypothetical protein